MPSKELKLSAGIIAVVINSIMALACFCYIIAFLVALFTAVYYGHEYYFLFIVCLISLCLSVAVIVLGAMLCRNKENKHVAVALIVLCGANLVFLNFIPLILTILYLCSLAMHELQILSQNTNCTMKESPKTKNEPALCMASHDGLMRKKLSVLRQLKEGGIINEKEYQKGIFIIIDKS